MLFKTEPHVHQFVCVCVRVFINKCFGRISRKGLGTEARFQWTTNRKWHVGNRVVT